MNQFARCPRQWTQQAAWLLAVLVVVGSAASTDAQIYATPPPQSYYPSYDSSTYQPGTAYPSYGSYPYTGSQAAYQGSRLPGRYYPGGAYPAGGYSGGYGGYYGSRSQDIRVRSSRTGRYSAASTPGAADWSTMAGTQARYGRSSRPTRTPPGATPSPGPSPAPGEGPLSTRPTGQRATVVKGQPPRPAAPGPQAQAQAPTASFTTKPSPDTAMLYMAPLQAIVAVGEEFETRVALSNPTGKEFQTIEAVVKFDPTVIEPIYLKDDKIRPLIEGEAESVAYADLGVLVYRTRLRSSLAGQAVEFFTVRWKTLAVSAGSELTFVSQGKERTALLDKSNSTILGGSVTEGLLGMTLQVFSPTELADGPPIGEELFAGSSEGALRYGGARLRLIANKQAIAANEDFYVGVWFENPKRVDVSNMSLKIRFDPNVLEVVDDDANNWITTGVNVFDGDYRDQFLFDVHLENSVSNDVGLISYAMACTQRRALPQRGYVARIRFRPKTLAAQTPIEFVFQPQDDPFRTQVCFLSNDVLGSPASADDGTEDLTLSIVEPRLPKRLVAGE